MGSDRRRVLAGSLTVLAGTLGGCGFLGGGGSSGDATVMSFEEGGLDPHFRDASDDAVSPQVSDARAADGQNALHLESTPGSDTRNRVEWTETTTAPVTVETSFLKYVDGGSQNAFSLALVDEDDGSILRIIDSDYFGGVHVFEERELGDQIRQAPLAPDLPAEEWHTVGLSVDADGTVTATVNEESRTYEPELSWSEKTLRPRLTANGWGGGSEIAVAVDAFELSASSG